MPLRNTLEPDFDEAQPAETSFLLVVGQVDAALRASVLRRTRNVAMRSLVRSVLAIAFSVAKLKTRGLSWVYIGVVIALDPGFRLTRMEHHVI